MKKIYMLLVVISVGIHAGSAFKDSDMDGIMDKKDKCKNTPFFDLVNSKGCTVKSLALKK